MRAKFQANVSKTSVSKTCVSKACVSKACVSKADTMAANFLHQKRESPNCCHNAGSFSR
jgi:hypothetical protein